MESAEDEKKPSDGLAAEPPPQEEEPCAAPVNVPEILEHLGDAFFYIKDRRSRWRDCNKATLRLFGVGDKKAIVGRTDRDFYPEKIAAEIIADDLEVIRSGRPILNKLEAIVDDSGRLLWVLTTKIPARDAQGGICGLIGLTRVVETTSMLPEGYRQFSRVIDHVEAHYRGPVEISQLAAIACLSESQFRKRFVKLFRISPQKFITRIRLQTAASLLASGDAPIVEIALSCGFCDQSYFTRQFTGFFAMTPKKYRDRWFAAKA